MSWAIAMLLGALAGLAGGFLAFHVGELVGKLHHITTFEGARAFFVVLVCCPAGFLIGLVAGVTRGRCSTAVSPSGFGVELALSVAITTAVLLAILGVAWLTADPSPELKGPALMARFEIRLPKGAPLYDENLENRVVASLLAGPSDHQPAQIDVRGVRHEGDIWIVRRWSSCARRARSARCSSACVPSRRRSSSSSCRRVRPTPTASGVLGAARHAGPMGPGSRATRPSPCAIESSRSASEEKGSDPFFSLTSPSSGHRSRS